MEAYGQTEMNAAITVQFPGDTTGGWHHSSSVLSLHLHGH